MEDKSGKGFPKGGKSALKNLLAREESLKEKDDTPIKTRRGRKVHFDSEDSLDGNNVPPTSDEKANTSYTKSDQSKAGKGGKTANSEKGSLSSERPLELRVEQDLPKNAKCVMDCEAARVLLGIQEQMIILSEDPTIKIPIAFGSCLQYAKSGSHYTKALSVRSVLERLKKHGVTEGEICVIANICPETIEEVFALLPTLKAKRNKLREPLRDVLGEMANLKRSSDAK